MILPDEHTVLPCDAGELCRRVLDGAGRILLFGPPGTGKSTLAAGLARALVAGGRDCLAISADPGSPAFGLPGAVSLGRWQGGEWQVLRYEALCTLDAGRFRLPLIAAVQRLAASSGQGVLLIDAPGVTRGVAGAELLSGLVQAAVVDAVLVLGDAQRPPPLLQELQALDVAVWRVAASDQARSPGRLRRAAQRTRSWDRYLETAQDIELTLDGRPCLGTPPPASAAAWQGRQVGLLRRGATLAMGEVTALAGKGLRLRLPGGMETAAQADALLVRDAMRDARGRLSTAPAFVSEPMGRVQAGGADVPARPQMVGRVGSLQVELINGVFGDPLLHVRLGHRRRSLLFDLGEGARLSARLAHQVTDVFISHAHLDHIAGFLWLLRSRIGEYPPCRLYGPPGLARHVAGFLAGILWDRVEDWAPVFEVLELHGTTLRRYRLRAGEEGWTALGERAAADGVLLQETEFRVRAETLDHRHTRVLAYAFEPVCQLNVRKDRLQARGLSPGPWLGELKRRVLAQDLQARIHLPDGTWGRAAELGEALLLVSPPKRLVYATDLADTPENRRRLVALARHAHTFFCEAAFRQADVELARRHGHLTTRACGEIAAEAGVGRLVPFHFSRRYEDDASPLYEEIRAVYGRVIGL